VDTVTLQRVGHEHASKSVDYFIHIVGFFVLSSGADIMNGKTKMTCAVIQVHGSQELTLTNPKDAANPVVGNAAIVLCQSFGSHGISPQVFHNSDESVFQSYTKAAAVEAFVKARQGYLFPLRRGLCFLEAVSIIKRQIIDYCETMLPKIVTSSLSMCYAAGNIHPY